MKIKACLFDFDGTFADTAFGLINTANFIFKKHNKMLINFDDGRAISSDGVRAFLKQRFDESVDNFDALTTEFLDYYQHHILDEIFLFDGIYDLLHLLEKKDIAWGVVTNKPRKLTEKILHHFNLTDRINILVCGDDNFKLKPAPDMISEAIRQLRVNPNQVIYVGDGHRDIKSANAAGVTSILVTYGYIKPEDNYLTWGAKKIIEDLSSLEKELN